MKTLYEYATENMKISIQHYFEIVEETSNFTNFKIDTFNKPYACQMILAGKSLEYKNLTPKQCYENINRVSAIKFDIEKGVSAYVYENTRDYIESLT